jgi:hypothetical protein
LNDNKIIFFDLTFPWKVFEYQFLRLNPMNSLSSTIIPISLTSRFPIDEKSSIFIEFCQHLQDQTFQFAGNSFTGNQLSNVGLHCLAIDPINHHLGWALQTLWDTEISVLFHFDDSNLTQNKNSSPGDIPFLAVGNGNLPDLTSTANGLYEIKGRLIIRCQEEQTLGGILNDLDEFISGLSGGFFSRC